MYKNCTCAKRTAHVLKEMPCATRTAHMYKNCTSAKRSAHMYKNCTCMCYKNCHVLKEVHICTRTAHVLRELPCAKRTAHVSSCRLFIALSHNATTGTSFMKTLKLSYHNIIAVQRISYLQQICRNVLASAFNTVLILNSANSYSLKRKLHRLNIKSSCLA